MKRAITIFVVAVFALTISAQEKAPKPNSVADFEHRPLEDLIAALKDKDKAIRQSAAFALHSHESFPHALPDKLIPDLVAGLRDSDPEVRRDLLYAVGRLRNRARAAVPTLRTMLKDSLPLTRVRAALALHHIAASEPVVPILIEGVNCSDWLLRNWAAQMLGEMPSRPKEAIEPLRQHLQDKNASVRVAAARALWRINKDPAVLPVLLEIAKSEKGYARQEALEGLGLRGLDGAKIQPVLREALKDKESLVRGRAALALGTVDARIEERLPLLQTAMKDEHMGVRQMAAQGLKHLGPAAKPAVPQLIAALRAGDERLRFDALETLGAIGPGAAAAAPAVAEVLRGKGRGDRAVALLTLLQIGPQARAALPDIRRVVEDEKPPLRLLAAAVAWRVGDDAKGRDIVKAALDSKDMELRAGAAFVLGEIGTPAKEMVPKLRAMLHENAAFPRLAAAHSLWRLAADESAIPVMIELLGDKREDVRREAATRLGEIGLAAKKAVPALKRVVRDDDDEFVQKSAAEALDKILPDETKP